MDNSDPKSVLESMGKGGGGEKGHFDKLSLLPGPFLTGWICLLNNVFQEHVSFLLQRRGQA